MTQVLIIGADTALEQQFARVTDGDLVQLTVEHRAVGDDDDLVEDRRVVLAVQARERVCRPRDGV